MAYEFIADSDKLEDLRTELSNTVNDLTNCIDDMFLKINDLNTVWSGETYDVFKDKCLSYRVELEELLETLNYFYGDLGTLSADATVMIGNIRALLDCTGISIVDGESGISDI